MKLQQPVTMNLTLTVKEWCRLYHMAEHIGEEAHDMPDDDEPWYKEKWWKNFAYKIENHLKEAGCSEEMLEFYDEEEESVIHPLVNDFLLAEAQSLGSWPFKLYEKIDAAFDDLDFKYEYSGDAYKVRLTHDDVTISFVAEEPFTECNIPLDEFEASLDAWNIHIQQIAKQDKPKK